MFPTMNPFLTHGAISWSEHLAVDPATTIQFYNKLLDWQHAEMPMEMEGGGVYYVATSDGTNAAGMMKRPSDEIPPCWGFYITVHDMEGWVKTHNPHLCVPVTPTPMGPFCGIMDPQGAMIYAIEYAAPEKESEGLTDFVTAFRRHGLFSWFELHTPDSAAAAEYYGQLLGWTFKEQSTPMGPYRTIQVGDVGIGGISEFLPEGAPPHWSGYITVDDVDARTARVASLGGTINAGPFDIPDVGRTSHIKDPDGAPVSLITYAEWEA